MKKALVLFALTTYLSAEKNVGEIIGKCLNSKAQVTSAKTPPVVPPRGPQGATSSSTGKSGGQRSLGDILKQKQQKQRFADILRRIFQFFRKQNL